MTIDRANSINAVVHEWRQRGLNLNPGASEGQLAKLQSLLRTPLPADVARFYRLANGMVDYVEDDHRVSFWSIERIAAERHESRPDEVAFADFLISSWHFVYRLKPPDPPAIGWESEPTNSMPSLTALFSAYLGGADQFYVL